jgi:hypothetical protein
LSSPVFAHWGAYGAPPVTPTGTGCLGLSDAILSAPGFCLWSRLTSSWLATLVLLNSQRTPTPPLTDQTQIETTAQHTHGNRFEHGQAKAKPVPRPAATIMPPHDSLNANFMLTLARCSMQGVLLVRDACATPFVAACAQSAPARSAALLMKPAPEATHECSKVAPPSLSRQLQHASPISKVIRGIHGQPPLAQIITRAFRNHFISISIVDINNCPSFANTVWTCRTHVHRLFLTGVPLMQTSSAEAA